MSNSANKTISFVAGSYSESEDLEYGVLMEQVEISETSKKANITDILSMFARGRSGLTAYSYFPTSLSYVKFTNTSMEVELDFWVWPIPFELEYTLSLSGGTISDGYAGTQQKIGNIVVPMTNSVKLDYSINYQASTATWETPCYSEDGKFRNTPTISFNKQYIYFEENVFGILRANLTAKGYKYTATLVFSKNKDGRDTVSDMITNQKLYDSVTDAGCTVICDYLDENGDSASTKLTLIIPDAILSLLEECDDDSLVAEPRCEESNKTHIDYYYSTCTGEILDTVRTESKGCESDE